MSDARSKLYHEGVLSGGFSAEEIELVDDLKLGGEDEDLADISESFNSVKGGFSKPVQK